MIAKLLGAFLLISGAFLFRERLAAPGKARLSALWELSQALTLLARGIADTRTPMPQLLKTRGLGVYADGFFAAVYEGAFERGEALSDSWRRAVNVLPLHESEREELRALGGRFSESAQELGKKLELCAARLHEQWVDAKREQKEREKTEGPLCLCAALLLVICLI